MATLTQLEYIVSVDRLGNFSKAAEACHVSQPSLSLLIRKLEEELGTVIFDRSKKPVLTTAKGREIVDQAKVILSESKKLLELSRSTQDYLSGQLNLGVIPTLAPYLVPRFVEPFAQKYPKVELTIEEMKTSEIVAALDSDLIDAGLLATPLHISRLEERVLFYEPFYLYASDKHPLFKKSRVKEADLTQSDVWLLGEGHCLRNQVVHLCSNKKKAGVFKNVHFESGHLETLKRLVDQSSGYTLLPHLAIEDIRGTAAMARIKPFVRPIPTREISLVFRRRQLKSTLLDRLADVIVANVPKRLFELKNQDMEILEI